eukprot:g25895.t1
MDGNGKVFLIIAYGVQVLCKFVTKFIFALTNVEEATSGVTDTADLVGGCTGEPLLDMELPTYIRDTIHALHLLQDFQFPGPQNLIFTMDIQS